MLYYKNRIYFIITLSAGSFFRLFFIQVLFYVLKKRALVSLSVSLMEKEIPKELTITLKLEKGKHIAILVA